MKEDEIYWCKLDNDKSGKPVSTNTLMFRLVTLELHYDASNVWGWVNGLPLTSPTHSAILQHSKSTGHWIFQYNFKIINKTRNKKDIRALESLYKTITNVHQYIFDPKFFHYHYKFIN